MEDKKKIEEDSNEKYCLECGEIHEISEDGSCQFMHDFRVDFDQITFQEL